MHEAVQIVSHNDPKETEVPHVSEVDIDGMYINFLCESPANCVRMSEGSLKWNGQTATPIFAGRLSGH